MVLETRHQSTDAETKDRSNDPFSEANRDKISLWRELDRLHQADEASRAKVADGRRSRNKSDKQSEESATNKKTLEATEAQQRPPSSEAQTEAQRQASSRHLAISYLKSRQEALKRTQAAEAKPVVAADLAYLESLRLKIDRPEAVVEVEIEAAYYELMANVEAFLESKLGPAETEVKSPTPESAELNSPQANIDPVKASRIGKLLGLGSQIGQSKSARQDRTETNNEGSPNDEASHPTEATAEQSVGQPKDFARFEPIVMAANSTGYATSKGGGERLPRPNRRSDTDNKVGPLRADKQPATDPNPPTAIGDILRANKRKVAKVGRQTIAKPKEIEPSELEPKTANQTAAAIYQREADIRAEVNRQNKTTEASQSAAKDRQPTVPYQGEITIQHQSLKPNQPPRPPESLLAPHNLSSRPELPNVKQLSTPDLLFIANDIKIDGTAVRRLYDTNQIDHAGLVAIVNEAMRGGNVKKMYAKHRLGEEAQAGRKVEMRHDSTATTKSSDQTIYSAQSAIAQAQAQLSDIPDFLSGKLITDDSLQAELKRSAQAQHNLDTTKPLEPTQSTEEAPNSARQSSAEIKQLRQAKFDQIQTQAVGLPLSIILIAGAVAIAIGVLLNFV